MYQYTIKYFDGEFRDERGLIGGCATYAEAMTKLTDYYGEDGVVSVALECVKDEQFVLPYTTMDFNITSVVEDY